jgi:hypothetical protein
MIFAPLSTLNVNFSSHGDFFFTIFCVIEFYKSNVKFAGHELSDWRTIFLKYLAST